MLLFAELSLSSFLPNYEIFYRLLNHLAVIIKSAKHNNPLPQLQSIYDMPIPKYSEPAMAVTTDVLYVRKENGRIQLMVFVNKVLTVNRLIYYSYQSE